MFSMQERREAVTKSALFHQQAGSFCYLQEIDLQGLWWKIRLHASRPRYSLVWVESCYIAEHSNGEPFWEGPIHRVLKTPKMLTPQEKRPVGLVCLQCHDEGEADERAYTDIDENPRWTLGNNRPLCFECQKYCRNCIRI